MTVECCLCLLMLLKTSSGIHVKRLGVVLDMQHCPALQEGCNVRDCKIGPGYMLADGSEPRDEVLAKQKLPQ